MPIMLKAIIKGIKGIIMLLMIMMVFTVTYGVFTRYVLNSAAVWTGELAGYILVWITFLGSAWALFEKSHIGFDALVKKFPRPLFLLFQVVFNLMMLSFVAAMTYYGFIVTGNAMNDDTLTLPISKGIIYAVVPISGVIMMVAIFWEVFTLFKVKDVKEVEGRLEIPDQRQVSNGG